MKIDFSGIELSSIPNFKNGTGITDANIFFDGKNRILLCRIRPGSSIGLHTHETNSEIMFFLSGQGRVVCDGEEEIVGKGSCHYCPKGSSHTTINTGSEDLVLYAVVAEQ